MDAVFWTAAAGSAWSAVPPRFVSFCAVGIAGVLVHLATLAVLNGTQDVSFATKQWGATVVAMTANFFLNNLGSVSP